jgi:hypothetical protein
MLADSTANTMITTLFFKDVQLIRPSRAILVLSMIHTYNSVRIVVLDII